MSDLSTLGTGTGGVWTRREALDRLRSGQIRGRLADGRWQRLLSGVYADGGIAPDAAMRAWAAVRGSGKGSVACARTAARLWGLPLVDDDDPATGRQDRHLHDVAVPAHRGRRTSPSTSDTGQEVVRRRQLTFADDEVVVHDCGLPVTSPARTLRDLAGVLRFDALVCAVDHALRQGLVTRELLERQVDRAKGTRQGPRFREAVRLSDPRAESPAETLARLVLLPVLPGLVPQVSVREPSGLVVAVLDLADEELMLAFEVDGKRGHAGAQMVAKDRRRDRRTEGFGWHTERLTWWELRRQPAAVQARAVQLARRVRGAA